MKNDTVVWNQPKGNKFNGKRTLSSLRNIQKTLRENGIPFTVRTRKENDTTPLAVNEIPHHHAIKVPAKFASIAAGLIVKNNGRNYGGADWLAHMSAAGR